MADLTFLGHHDHEDYSILGSMSGSPYLETLPYLCLSVGFAKWGVLQRTRKCSKYKGIAIKVPIQGSIGIVSNHSHLYTCIYVLIDGRCLLILGDLDALGDRWGASQI